MKTTRKKTGTGNLSAVRALQIALPFLKSRDAGQAYISARYALSALRGKPASVIYWQPKGV